MQVGTGYTNSHGDRFIIVINEALWMPIHGALESGSPSPSLSPMWKTCRQHVGIMWTTYGSVSFVIVKQDMKEDNIRAKYYNYSHSYSHSHSHNHV